MYGGFLQIIVHSLVDVENTQTFSGEITNISARLLSKVDSEFPNEEKGPFKASVSKDVIATVVIVFACGSTFKISENFSFPLCPPKIKICLLAYTI
jgi:hypothetical protein